MTKVLRYSAALLLVTALSLLVGGSAAAQSTNNPRYRQFRDTAAASITTPASGNVRLFFDSTGFYWKNSAGTTTAVGGTLSGLTTGVVPQAGSATTIVNSKMTTSGANSGTWTLYDDGGTGITQLFVRSGASQSTNNQLLIGSTSTGLFESAASVLKVTDGSTGFGSVTAAAYGANTGSSGAASFFFNGDPNTGIYSDSADRLFLSAGGNTAFLSNTLFRSPTIFQIGASDITFTRVGSGIVQLSDGAGGQSGFGASDAATNTVTDALILRHQGGTVAGNGFGTGLVWQGENDGGVMHPMASIDAVYVTDDDTAEDVKMVFSAYTNGTEYEIFTIDPFDPAVAGPVLRFSASTGGPGRISSASILQVTAATDLVFGEEGVATRWTIPETTGHFVPGTDNTYDIGTPSAQVRTGYFVGLTLSSVGYISTPAIGPATNGNVALMLNGASATASIGDTGGFPGSVGGGLINLSRNPANLIEMTAPLSVTHIQGVRTRVLVDNTIQDFVQISSTAEANANGVTAGRIQYTVVASDATTDIVQTETGVVPFLLVNENGTVTVTLGTVYGTAIDSAGGAALANTFASSVTGTNAMIRVTSDYDQATLTGTVTHNIRYRVFIDSGTATVTPQ